MAHIRQFDPRPFLCLAIYAVEGDEILGQVGIFRLPMVTTDGGEDVGGIWAVSTHPQYAGLGVASRLLEEAHTRMRNAGLRFSTLGTDRYRVAHKLYRRHGHEETFVWSTALARWETAHQPTRLHAEPAGVDGYDFIEQIYSDIAKNYLGFAWRYTPFERLRRINLSDIWILKKNNAVVGYALTITGLNVLKISNLVLQQEIDTAEALAALAAELRSGYVQVTISRPSETMSLKRAGYYVANPNWAGFMIKPLQPDIAMEDAVQLFGIGTDRFLISWLDVT